MDGLVGRDAELARIDALVDGAAAGAGGALLLFGEAGIGKTSLLGHAGARAAAHGMTVLRARAVDAERELPFAGLAELVAPVAGLVREHAPELLAAADARSGGVGRHPAPGTTSTAARADGPTAAREPDGSTTAHDADGPTAADDAADRAAGDDAPARRLTTAVALLRLLEALAAGSPAGLAVLVDDVHLLDEASLDALLFAARRLGAEPVAVVLAARPEPDRGLPGRGIDLVEPAALDADDARRLLGDRLAPGPLRTVLEHAAGNPLALVELARTMTEPERAGAAPLHAPVRPGDALGRAFRSQLDALPADTRRALVVPAADERAPRGRVRGVLADLGLPADALDAAERAGVLVGEDRRLRFRHPVLRSVAYHAAPEPERAAVHRALAAHLDGGADGDAARRAWHLAAAADGPDEAAAAALQAAGDHAWRRGALGEAADAHARAAELTPADRPDARAARILPAARLLALADQPQRALALAEQALRPPPGDPALRAALEHVQGAVTMRTGDLEGGSRILVEAADRVAAAAPARAAQMLLDANLRNRVVGDYPEMVRLARRTRDLAAADDPALSALGDLTEAIALVNTGDGAAADGVLARHEAVLLDPASTRFGLEALASPAHASVWLERHDRADRVLTALIDRARGRSAVTALVYPLAVRAQAALRRGRLRAAHADAEEAVRLAVETRQFGLLGIAAAMLAETEAALGREDGCREHAARSIAISDAVGGHAMGTWGRGALGLLELALGRPAEAVAPLQACAALADRIGMDEPNTVQWVANLAEALVATGRGDDARELLPRLRRGAGTAWAAAAELRCRGLVTHGEEGEALLVRAVPAFEAGDARFEAARTRLALGERRRRDGRRRDSREPLEAALAAFEAEGAAPWAERARAELRAGGHPTGGVRAGGWDELTPHELRIALLVAEGRTNPEVAGQLFVTRKTVEHHLSHVYRKLGLRSRTELARALAADGA